MSRAQNQPIFAGLDCETTGSWVLEHKLIQIGVCLSGDRVYSSRVGWEQFKYDDAALAAIGVSPESIPLGPAAQTVDAELVSWLDEHKVPPGSIVPVGWGVSGFDIPFVARTLPLFSERFLTHRTVELNAVCYTLGDAKPYMDRPRSAAEWKTMAKRVAEFHALIGYGYKPQWHDAGYDALTSLLAWQWMRNIVRDPSPATSKASRPSASRERDANRTIDKCESS